MADPGTRRARAVKCHGIRCRQVELNRRRRRDIKMLRSTIGCTSMTGCARYLMITYTVPSTPVRPDVSCRCASVRSNIMAGQATCRVCDRTGYVTCRTGWTDSGNSLQIGAVTKNTLVGESLCIGMLIIEGVVIPRPVIAPTTGRVGRPVVMTPFASLATGRGNANIKTGRGRCGRSMTRLTV